MSTRGRPRPPRPLSCTGAARSRVSLLSLLLTWAAFISSHCAAGVVLYFPHLTFLLHTHPTELPQVPKLQPDLEGS